MAEIGHNSAVTPEGMNATSMALIARAEAAKHRANEDLRLVKKKAEGNGLDIKAAAEARKAYEAGKIPETIRRMANTISYMRVLGAIITKNQIEMFDVLEAEPTLDERAYSEGRTTGLMDFDDTAASPHSPSVPAGQAWLKGYHVGRDERRMIMAMSAEHKIVDPPKKRAGRKPKLVVDNKPASTEDDDMATPGGAEVDADGIPTAEAAPPIEETPATPETKAVDFDKLPVPPKPALDPNAPIAGGGASFDEAAPTFLDRRRKKAAAPAAEATPPADVPPPQGADAEEDPDL